ncbi:MAG: BON domain-containing protein [Burkholderiaceae bacterium]|nr:BON domain-containing protein [Sulfuritalea sp.]MCF8176000.1 BON domain-containing protein [Burkholderiaceae bacterium]
MKLSKSWKLLGLSMLMLGGLAACGDPGSAETAGRSIDRAADAAGKKFEQTADAAGKTMTEAADKVSEKLGEQGVKAGVAVEDAEITARVKAAIFAEPGLRTLQISVDTIKGVVTLTGSVDTPPSSDKARNLAAAVAGVSEVDNKLVPTSTR